MTRKVPGYEGEVQLGRGPTGTVVSARDAATGTTVAIKYLSDNVYRYPNFSGRFRGEAAILDGIEHPNVVQVYEFVELGDGGAIVSELVDGVSLRRVLDEGGALEPEAAFYVLQGVLLGLGEVHGRGLVHRDLRPENVLINTEGVVKIADIGIAARARRSSPFAGDPRYAAPELWKGAEPTPSTDVYAAAAMLRECLSGTPPRAHDVMRDAGSLDEFITSLRGAEPPNQVRVLLASGLAAEPAGRPGDADHMLDDLERVAALAYGKTWELTGQGLLARRLGPALAGPASGGRVGKRRASAGAGARVAEAVALVTGTVAGLTARLTAKRAGGSARSSAEADDLAAAGEWADTLAGTASESWPDSAGRGWTDSSPGSPAPASAPPMSAPPMSAPPTSAPPASAAPASAPPGSPAVSRGRSRASAAAAAAAGASAARDSTSTESWIDPRGAAAGADPTTRAWPEPRGGSRADAWDGTSTESWVDPQAVSRGRSRAGAAADSWDETRAEAWVEPPPPPRAAAGAGGWTEARAAAGAEAATEVRVEPPPVPLRRPSRIGATPPPASSFWDTARPAGTTGATQRVPVEPRSGFWDDPESRDEPEERRGRRGTAGAGQLRGLAAGAGSGVRRAAGFVGGLGNAWLVGGGSVLVIGSAVILALVSGAFATDTAPTTTTTTRESIVVTGPAVPSPTGPVTDTVKPDQPTGLRVIGQSQTAVSLDWEPSRDNDKVAGYIVTLNGQQAGTTAEPGYTAAALTPNTKYDFTVIAFDSAGNQSATSAVLSATTLAEPDTAAPTVPAGLRSTGRSTTTVALAWNASTDNVGVAGYDVFRDGNRVATVVRPSYTDTGLAAASSHAYAVRAFDTANNLSANSPTLTVVTLTAPDTTPPTAPGAVTATATGTSTISVTWTAATDNIGIAQYRVSRNGTQVGIVTTTSFNDTGLDPATTYTYSVVAADAANNVSPAGTDSATTQALPTVTALTLSASAIAAPDCTTAITAHVTASGPLSVTVTYTIGGVSDSKPVTFTVAGSQDVVLGSGDGRAPGSAQATANPGAKTDSVTWTAPDECLPTPSP